MSEQRNGFSLIELLAAAVLTAALMALSLECVQLAHAVRRSDEQRAAAAQEASNLMETLFAIDPSDETIAAISAAKTSPLIPDGTSFIISG